MKMKGTPFQQKVWRACQTIPRGEVRSYQWIAKKIGHPKAVRAVGTALAKNPTPIIVPCHRVIRSDGKLGGFSAPGGLKRKKELLAQEKKIL
ncbi:MAG: MGMT family protein [Deltaproteobacteria bacterium]|nr:MGMT family protein [Deltaproteobacteria bacterium]